MMYLYLSIHNVQFQRRQRQRLQQRHLAYTRHSRVISKIVHVDGPMTQQHPADGHDVKDKPMVFSLVRILVRYTKRHVSL
jgi:hypothetical protein